MPHAAEPARIRLGGENMTTRPRRRVLARRKARACHKPARQKKPRLQMSLSNGRWEIISRPSRRRSLKSC
jgi:hypothetical protein